MYLRIQGEEKIEEKSVWLKLEQCGDDIRVKIVDRDGLHIGGGYILTIFADGTIGRSANVSKALGFQLDDKGRVMLDE